jgi:membrane protein required for colicin V production
MWYDLIMLGILIVATTRGAKKGFVWQLASIAALVLCFVFASRFAGGLASHIDVRPPLDRWIAMLLLYALFAFGCFAAARVLHEMIEKWKFVEYDRHLGGVFGLLKGAILCVLATFFLAAIVESARPYVVGTITARLSANVLDHLTPVIPPDIHEVLEPYLNQIDGRVADVGDDVKSKPGDDDARKSPKAEEDDTLAARLAAIDGLVTEELRKLVRTSLENTKSGDRDELVAQLAGGITGKIRAVATEWLHGKPPLGEVEESERDKLLTDIAAAYADYPDAQSTFAEEVEALLTGVPETPALETLRDWRADLYAGQGDADLDLDPDPVTDRETSFGQRLLRQLDKANVPLEDLPAELRSRLRLVLPR